MKRPPSRPSLLFRTVVPVTVVFILTVLALIASLFGNPEAPVSVWLEEHGNQLLLWELAAVIAVAILSMTVDRIRTLRGTDPEMSAAKDKATAPREHNPEDTET